MHSFGGKTITLATALVALSFSGAANAVLVDGIDFDNSWFADSVVQFNQVKNIDNEPGFEFSDPGQALGVPDVDPNPIASLPCITAPSPDNCKFTSLGDGGSLTLEFTDNFLNGDGTPANDLYVIEVGEAEGFQIEVSPDNLVWTLVGTVPPDDTLPVGVFTYGFDIDAAGFGITDMLTFVRLTDSNFGDTSNPPGSDIDAVGAIQTVIPVPAALPLFVSALAGLGLWRRRMAP